MQNPPKILKFMWNLSLKQKKLCVCHVCVFPQKMWNISWYHRLTIWIHTTNSTKFTPYSGGGELLVPSSTAWICCFCLFLYTCRICTRYTQKLSKLGKCYPSSNFWYIHLKNTKYSTKWISICFKNYIKVHLMSDHFKAQFFFSVYYNVIFNSQFLALI